MERKVISRREFLIGGGLTVVVAGCKRVEEKLPVVVVAAELPIATSEPAQTSTKESTATQTPKPKDTETQAPTATIRPTAAETATLTQTPTATETTVPSPTATETAIATAAETATEMLTKTPTKTATATETATSKPTEITLPTATTAPTKRIELGPPKVLEETARGITILELRLEDIEFMATHEISHGDPQKRAIALTFDAGADSRPWPTIREAIKKHQIKLTVFLTADFIRKNPVYVREMVALGLEIGNHSSTHPDFTKRISAEEMKQEVIGCQRALDEVLGYHLPMRFFRFPFGARDTQTMRVVAELGLQSVFWSQGGDSGGWQKIGKREVLERLNGGLRPGQIFVQHVGSPEDAETLAKYLETVAEEGYQVLPLSRIVADKDKPPSVVAVEEEFPGANLAFKIPGYEFQPIKKTEWSKEEKIEYLAFLGEFQEKVNKKRQKRAKKDGDYLRRTNIELNKNRVNFLLLGLDRRTKEGRNENAWHADAPLIISINTKTGQVDLTQIPRDLHAPEVDDLSSKYKGTAFRINAITMFGGLNDARRVFENATGLSQDFCFSLDFEAFRGVVDVLGGVLINIDPDFVRRYQEEINEWIDGEIEVGWQYLSGRRAFNYIHWRKKGSDILRGRRQLQMVKAIARTAIARVKESPLFIGKIAKFALDLKKEKGIDFASEFSLLDFVGVINDLKRVNLELATNNFISHDPWYILTESHRTKDKWQIYFKNVPIEDPKDPLDYWHPLRNYIAQNFE